LTLCCRLGPAVLRGCVAKAEADRLLAAAGVIVFEGADLTERGLREDSPQADGNRVVPMAARPRAREAAARAACKPVRVLRMDRFEELDALPWTEERAEQETDGIVWIRGLSRAYCGPGIERLHRLRNRLPGMRIGVWAEGPPALSVAVAVEAALDGADALVCAGPDVRVGPPLERVAAALSHFGVTGIEDAGIVTAVRRVAALAGVSLPAHAPVVGSRIFEVGTGIHVDGILKNAMAYEPWHPERYGQARRFVPGPLSGRAANKIASDPDGLFGVETP